MDDFDNKVQVDTEQVKVQVDTLVLESGDTDLGDRIHPLEEVREVTEDERDSLFVVFPDCLGDREQKRDKKKKTECNQAQEEPEEETDTPENKQSKVIRNNPSKVFIDRDEEGFLKLDTVRAELKNIEVKMDCRLIVTDILIEVVKESEN